MGSCEWRLNDNVGEVIYTLINAQSIIFNTVIEAINGKYNDRLIFINGLGGTGKSYLLKVVLYLNIFKTSNFF